ncbi:MAG: hypothetical protein IT214_05515 [Chitinophagaceae bacterium]|nr:hypothetical protein [Chitinophagaceae bacterium]OQY91897.1 MAG: hypothetical protein B6D37_15595 [Sphingobacteriales bacterium UTBCD1]
MRIILQNERSNHTIFMAVIVLMTSLFISRAFLSISLILFSALTILHKNGPAQLKKTLKDPFLVSISLFFLIPFISGLWSVDWKEWLSVIKNKLPFLFLPVAFAGSWQLSEKQWKTIAYLFLALVLISCFRSLWLYFMDIRAINESYLRAKTIPTILDDDHVRFSWLVSIAILVNSLLVYISKSVKRKVLLFFPLILMVVYLHLLAVRTGLVSMYFFFFCFFFFLLLKQKKYSFFLASGIVLIGAVSWWSFPTLRNKIKYVRYDFSFVKSGGVPGTSDANRLISLDAGWYILQNNPFGVGAGDFRNEVNKWYEKNIPGIKEPDIIFPSSEWAVYGDMAGWPAVLLFTFAIGFPLFVRKIRYRFFWSMLVSILIIGCLAETTLEVQFGIFIYCFTILWMWKWFQFQNE